MRKYRPCTKLNCQRAPNELRAESLRQQSVVSPPRVDSWKIREFSGERKKEEEEKIDFDR